MKWNSSYPKKSGFNAALKAAAKLPLPYAKPTIGLLIVHNIEGMLEQNLGKCLKSIERMGQRRR